ncbi:MAG: penicillin-binding protein 2 [Hyphomonas sp.]|uniref:peptidoglycan D,D-transpeptidase FtsI family protein n=1 Tax=Hyphomonas sp. TaxID=87 RepID=UPI0017D2C4F5|nr:penicillin-binding protein 2 [Hyphomonas sp.]MBA3069355.1 penicillin-binding protein 2 [Hyphomonas sp.]MBU3922309.1 penicillin-binding protein 2 [Alphaproteobacteria bacterium]MBU4063737.1 penicillin-binding protein 2 [Alphaproteobacteria bacterium]MBU4164302.1 penicillin-binding protein 2 [Alphaproteobacteria bacterium]
MSEASRDRTRLAGLVLCGVFVVMAGRGGYLALSGKPQSDRLTLAQQAAPSTVRAEILDRNGELLAKSVESYSLWANPSLIWDAEEVALGLDAMFPEIGLDVLKSKLSDPKRQFEWVKRGLTPRQREAVMALRFEGLNFRSEMRRAYPLGELAGSVLGQVDLDGKGIAGAERTFNDALKAGRPVQLTLDIEVQTALEAELAAAAANYDMQGAAAILMDTHTGEVLGMASWPAYDPNRPSDFPANHPARVNRAIGAVYELGSVFKPLTIAAALEAGAVRPESRFNVSQPIRLGKFEVKDTHAFAQSANLTEIIVQSSNIGTVHVARELGIPRQTAFLKQAGLLDKAVIELPGSEAPIKPDRLSDVSAATISYGHGISVTPLAFLSAFAALGNGGEMAPPTLLLDPERKVEPVVLMSGVTAEIVTRMMRESVLRGTGDTADVEGYRVAGKTGTGEKPLNGGYDKNANISSFAAVFPADGPQYALIVTLDDPKARKGRGATASGSSAPVAGRIIERVAPILGVTPRFDDIRPVRTGRSEPPEERSAL